MNGVSNKRVMKAMSPHGFGRARLEDGWQHVRKPSAARLLPAVFRFVSSRPRPST